MDYSSRILNLRLDTRAEVAPMKFGHADARYAAAEIAREAEAEIEELKSKLELAGRALNRLLHPTYSDLRIEAATKEEWAARAINAEAKGMIPDVHEEPEEDGQFVSDESNIEGNK